jgi:hypothetical protein
MVARRTSTEIPARHEEHNDLYWFGPPESKTLRPIRWSNYAREIYLRGGFCRRALEGHPRTPYIGWRALGYKLVCIYPSWLHQGNLIRAGLSCLVLHAVFMSLGPHIRLGGPTDRSMGLLAGRARLSGTTETLVGGDPWVPMFLKLPIDVYT